MEEIIMKKTLWYYGRKILGRRGTFLLRNIISTIAFHLHLIPPATSTSKKKCISAMTLTCNDPDWLEPSLLSIKDLVDEYVVIDSSTDETPEILKKLRDKYNLNMKIIYLPPGNLVKARNLGLQNVSCKWVLIWDSDFVAKPEMGTVIKSLLKNLDEKYYYLIYWPMIRICGDLFHVSTNPYHIEHWLYTWSPKLKYTKINKHDTLIAPITMYKAILINKPLGVHIYVRTPKRIAIKYLTWKKPWTQKLLNKGYSLEEIAKMKAKEMFGTEDLEEVGRILLKNTSKTKVKPYDEKLFGPYPEILKHYANRLNLNNL